MGTTSGVKIAPLLGADSKSLPEQPGTSHRKEAVLCTRSDGHQMHVPQEQAGAWDVSLVGSGPGTDSGPDCGPV